MKSLGYSKEGVERLIEPGFHNRTAVKSNTFSSQSHAVSEITLRQERHTPGPLKRTTEGHGKYAESSMQSRNVTAVNRPSTQEAKPHISQSPSLSSPSMKSTRPISALGLSLGSYKQASLPPELLLRHQASNLAVSQRGRRPNRGLLESPTRKDTGTVHDRSSSGRFRRTTSRLGLNMPRELQTHNIDTSMPRTQTGKDSGNGSTMKRQNRRTIDPELRSPSRTHGFLILTPSQCRFSQIETATHQCVHCSLVLICTWSHFLKPKQSGNATFEAGRDRKSQTCIGKDVKTPSQQSTVPSCYRLMH